MGQVSRNSGNFDPRMKYGDKVPLGACRREDRINRLDKEGLDAAIIYPSLDLTWETDTRRGLLAGDVPGAIIAGSRTGAADSGGRLIPVAHFSLSDPAGRRLNSNAQSSQVIRADG